MLTRFIAVGAGVGAALAIAFVVLAAQGDEDQIWVGALFIAMPVGVAAGAALGLVAGLVRASGGSRWLAVAASTATYAVAFALLGVSAGWVLITASAIAALSWLGVLLADRWARRLA